MVKFGQTEKNTCSTVCLPKLNEEFGNPFRHLFKLGLHSNPESRVQKILTGFSNGSLPSFSNLPVFSVCVRIVL